MLCRGCDSGHFSYCHNINFLLSWDYKSSKLKPNEEISALHVPRPTSQPQKRTLSTLKGRKSSCCIGAQALVESGAQQCRADYFHFVGHTGTRGRRKPCNTICLCPLGIHSGENGGARGNLMVVIVTGCGIEPELKSTEGSDSRHCKYQL